MSKPFRIGMLGAGTVGGGVYELLMGTSAATAAAGSIPSTKITVVSGRPVTITKLCVRSLNKPRDFQICADRTVVTTDPNDLLHDDIDCVVEVAGGCGVAKDLILSALGQGKMVVTANKAVLFEHMAEIMAKAAAAAPSARIGYEAAVCGGIPIINALTTAYVSDRIQSVQGICNGTTNYMLSKMAADISIQYADVLKEAQDLGFAEADPTADVEGHDVRAKIAILAKLAFGQSVTLDRILCTGISSVTATDFLLCRDNLNKSTIKLIGTAAVMDRRQLCVYVTPTVVPASSMLANIGGSGNCAQVVSDNLGACSYTGPGAGRYPTANSIVADVYRAASDTLPASAFPAPTAYSASSPLEVVSDYAASFYIRMSLAPLDDDFERELAALAEPHGLTFVATMRHLTTVAVTTSPCQRSAVDSFCQAVQHRVVGAPLFMPMLMDA